MRVFLPPIIHTIFGLRAQSHAQYASRCTKHFENESTVLSAQNFADDCDPVSLQEGEKFFRELKFASEFFVVLSKLHCLIYFEKKSDESRSLLIAELLSFFDVFTLDCVTTAEDGNMPVMLKRHHDLLLNNIAMSACVFSTYIGSLLSEEAGAETILEACEFFKFSRGKIICFISHPSIVVDRLHVH